MADIQSVEYEVLAEAKMSGEVKHEDFLFSIWELSNKSPGEKRKLCLRMTCEGLNVDCDELTRQATEASKDGRYTNLGRQQEIVVLSSLFLHRRFSLPTMVRMGDYPRIINLDHYDPCHELRSGSSNLANLKEPFQIWDQASEDFQHDYLRAARLYYFACTLMDKDLGAAYLMFTSAIETLASAYELIGVPTLSDVNPKLDSIIVKYVKDEDVAKKMREAALEREAFISRKFTEFALQNIEDKFWEEGTGPQYSRVKKEGIERVLKNIYRQRSKTLHVGEPFPFYMYMCPRDRGEIATAPAITAEGKKWEKKDYIPYIHFMERLTNHILRTALGRHVDQLPMTPADSRALVRAESHDNQKGLFRRLWRRITR